MTTDDVNEACNELKLWFIDRDLSPSEGVVVLTHFLGLMIVDNQKGQQDIEDKIDLFVDSIRFTIAQDSAQVN